VGALPEAPPLFSIYKKIIYYFYIDSKGTLYFVRLRTNLKAALGLAKNLVD
jgi:hypothetical protein